MFIECLILIHHQAAYQKTSQDQIRFVYFRVFGVFFHLEGVIRGRCGGELYLIKVNTYVFRHEKLSFIMQTWRNSYVCVSLTGVYKTLISH